MSINNKITHLLF